ncbi:putative pentatricopeptide repeat-containing protein [Tripterygium wilfordii]|uniref:Putative pentatricopeptide repeat-containing protein n=1 Tax=Tripterygium wilfordii TaxID=458696 RepID=A0A7J7DK40_TRIWF|nr:putative pentatricopeptide repeat-containing protein At5g40405 [Tripterygium wilfordii]KAF5746678.1 putative pentatricopeptide repeat-containing protein [Tripterygium wilfordii]
MRSSRCTIAKHPIISLVKASTTLRELKQIHSHLLSTGTLHDPRILGEFIATIALHNQKNLDYSEQIVNHCENPTLFTLNSLIRAHSKGSTPPKSFHFYNRILWSANNLSPDNYTFNFLVHACAQLSARTIGLTVHGAVLKHGFENDPHVQSALIYMYAELGCLRDCHQVFDEIPEPDLVCQTTMVSACARCGDVSFARELFDVMSERDHITWNAMIAGYVQCGKSKEALNLFCAMQTQGVKVSEVSMVSVLSACSHLGALDQGRWAHAYIESNKLPITATLGTALIDMYAKCGNVNKSMGIFWGMKEKNVYTWSTAINALAMNGDGHKCLELFSLMKKDGVQPNEVTFVSILRACSVVGLVEEGEEHFESIKKVYGIEPKLEHYGCMVDLYGRAGRLNEAVSFINNMAVKPHAGAWGALLSACRMYKNMELGELASRKLIALEAKNHHAYVLLSNIYADSNNWDKANYVRRIMKSRGVRKEPGCSAIEVDGEVHEFFVGDNSHPRYGDVDIV